MDILTKTGVPTKYRGDGLSSSDINKINGTVNLEVDVANLFLRSIYDANLENGTTQPYTLQEVILQVPDSRKRLGMRVRFFSIEGEYVELVYMGEDLENINWRNPDNWKSGKTINIIDGGEF
jgi:hypothetical protein